MRGALQSLLETAVQNLVREGYLPPEGLPPVEVSDPKDPSHGDFACTFALAASKAAGKPPREIAERLVAYLIPSDISDLSDLSDQRANESLISSAEIAGPGFINLRLSPAAVAAYVPMVLDLGVEGIKNSAAPIAHRASRIASQDSPIAYRASRIAPLRLNVEFVSVNPNGPITVGSGRGAAFGSTLCNVLEAAGHKVHREYYINDGVNSEQMRLFAESVRAIALGLPVPENGYRGEYVLHVAERIRAQLSGDLDALARRFEHRIQNIDDVLKKAYIVSERDRMLYLHHRLLRAINGARFLRQESATLNSVFERLGGELQVLAGDAAFNEQANDLENFGVYFDTWFSEQYLHDSDAVAACIEELHTKGAADEQPFQLEILKKKGEPDQIVKHDQPVEEEEEVGGEPLTVDGPEPEPEPPSSATSSSAARESDSSGTANGQPSTANAATLWLRSTKFGDQKDRVLRRKDGRLTYIASDVAYHKDKFSRGSKPDAEGQVQPADKLLTILGPDHHGYIGRLQAVVGALLEEAKGEGRRAKGEASLSDMSDKSDLSDFEAALYSSPAERDACQAALEEAKKRLEVVIFQIVRFVKDGKPAPMRKRDGNIYSLRDLMAEIGKNAAPNAPEAEQMRIGCDVARFFYLMRSHDTHMDFDLDLAEKQSDENPVYYVQYAHARICSVIGKAREAGLSVGGQQLTVDGPETANRQPRTVNSRLLTHPKELALIKKILDLPFEVRRCAEDYGVHRLTTYAMDLARAYHGFYDSCRVIQPEEPELSRARLALCEAARTGLRAVFELLGISAPERMERAEA